VGFPARPVKEHLLFVINLVPLFSTTRKGMEMQHTDVENHVKIAVRL